MRNIRGTKETHGGFGPKIWVRTDHELVGRVLRSKEALKLENDPCYRGTLYQRTLIAQRRAA